MPPECIDSHSEEEADLLNLGGGSAAPSILTSTDTSVGKTQGVDLLNIAGVCLSLLHFHFVGNYSFSFFYVTN